MEEIDLKELIGIFWEKKTTIILLIAIFMVLGFIYTSFIVVPEYTSSTTLLLAQAGSKEDSSAITTTDLTLNSKLISTYSKLVKSDKVIRKVKSNLGIDDSEESIKASVSVSAVEDADIIEIKAVNTDAEKAAQIANETAKVFMEAVKELYKIENIYTVDPAEVEEQPSNVNTVKDIIIFSAVGLVLGVGFIFIAYMLDNSIKDQDDVEKNIHVPVLANIPVYEGDEKMMIAKGKSSKKSKGGKRK